MIVTDGSPETYEEIFEKYNAPNYEVVHGAKARLCPLVLS